MANFRSILSPLLQVWWGVCHFIHVYIYLLLPPPPFALSDAVEVFQVTRYRHINILTPQPILISDPHMVLLQQYIHKTCSMYQHHL